MRKNRIKQIAAIVLLACSGWIVVSRSKSFNVNGSSKHELRKFKNGQQDNQSAKSSSRTKRETRLATSELTGEDYVKKWDSLGASLKGLELRSAKSALINDASSKLHGMELCMFLETLIKSGEFPNYEIEIIAASQLLFVTSNSDSSSLDLPQWLNGIDNSSVRQKLSYNLGLTYHGAQPREVLESLGDLKSKQAFLTAYCGTLAIGSPVDAFQQYQSQLPAGGSYSGLVTIASNVQFDFEKILALIPKDNRSVADDVRHALINSWGSKDPEAVSNFILNNPEKLAPENLAVAIGSWLKSDSVSALNWTIDLQPGKYRWIAVQSIADSWTKTQPDKAWNLVINEDIGETKKSVLMRIHAEWIKSDPKAAELARLSFEGSKPAPR